MLNQKVSIYVPSTTNVNTANENLHKELVVMTLTRLSKLFGGATAIQAKGGWVSDAVGLVLEDITIVYAFSDAESLTRNMGEVYDIARTICENASQECVSVETPNGLEFVGVQKNAA